MIISSGTTGPKNDSGEQSSSRERRILINSCYGHFLSHFNMLTFTAIVLPLTVRLDMSIPQVLSLSFWMYLLFGITALPWGILADRVASRGLFYLYYTGAGISALAAAAAIDTPALLPWCLAGIGLFSGIYHPVGLGMISKEIRRVSVGMGFNGMFGNLGLALGPIAAGAVNWLLGPTWIYLVLGVLNLTGILLLWFFPLTVSAPAPDAGSRDNSGQLKLFLVLLVAMMLGGIVYRGGTVILPTYFELKNLAVLDWLSGVAGRGLSPNLVATITVSLIYLFGMLGQYSGGRLAERIHPVRCYLLFHAATVPLAILMGSFTDLPLIVVALAYFFFLLGMQPAENTLVAGFTPRSLQHTAYGTKFVLTFGVGAVAVKIVGRIENLFGIETVFPVLATGSLLLVAVIVVLMYMLRTQKAL